MLYIFIALVAISYELMKLLVSSQLRYLHCSRLLFLPSCDYRAESSYGYIGPIVLSHRSLVLPFGVLVLGGLALNLRVGGAEGVEVISYTTLLYRFLLDVRKFPSYKTKKQNLCRDNQIRHI